MLYVNEFIHSKHSNSKVKKQKALQIVTGKRCTARSIPEPLSKTCYKYDESTTL